MLRRRVRGALHRVGAVGGIPHPASTYLLREGLSGAREGVWIEDVGRHRTFRLDGESAAQPGDLTLLDTAGVVRFRTRGRPAARSDSLAIECPSGAAIAIRRAMAAPIRDRFSVDLAGGGSWDVEGDIADHEYEIAGSDGHVATVSRRWSRGRDRYGVEIAPGEDDALVVLVAIVVDAMVQPGR